MNWELDWPVGRAGVAVVSPSGVETASLGGVADDDEFAVASVTKLMTPLAALAAVGSGRIDLDEPVPGPARASPSATCWPTPAASFEPRAGPGPGQTPHLLQRRLPGAGRGGRRRRGHDLRELAVDQRARPAGDAGDPARPPPRDRRHPAAGAVSTLEDLVRLARCSLERGAPVVGPDLFAEATTVQPRPGRPGPRRRPLRPLRLGPRLRAPRRRRPHWMGDRRPLSAFGPRGQRLLPLGRPRRRPGRRRRHRPRLRGRQVGHGHLARLVRPPARGGSRGALASSPGRSGDLVASRPGGRADRGAGVRIGVVTFPGPATTGTPAPPWPRWAPTPCPCGTATATSRRWTP